VLSIIFDSITDYLLFSVIITVVKTIVYFDSFGDWEKRMENNGRRNAAGARRELTPPRYLLVVVQQGIAISTGFVY
jgi:hypothetical protein